MRIRRVASRLMLRLSKIKSLMSVAQKLGLVSSFAKLYTALGSRNGVDLDRPVMFLGEALISPGRWSDQLRKLRLGATHGEPSSFDLSNHAPLPEGNGFVCSVICSIFKPGSHLEPFLNNLNAQSVFARVDFILIGVSLAVDEVALLKSFADNYSNVHLILSNERISIYHAWNLGVQEAKSDKITNMNVDDLRHYQSLEIQVRELEGSASTDVVYQDVFYMYEYLSNWSTIEAMGVRSHLPLVTTSVLARGLNAPHNAPMWRSDLHLKIGRFNEFFLSAGDHDFWIRASISGVSFQKSTLVHVSYFINPNGMSTKAGSPGLIEGARILDTYKKFA